MAISRFRIIEDLDNLTITQSHLNSHNDQHDYRIDAYHNNIHVGYADIVLYDGELTISYIEVDEKSRRLGIGSNIINYIKNNPEFEGYEYVQSWKTELGSKFRPIHN